MLLLDVDNFDLLWCNECGTYVRRNNERNIVAGERCPSPECDSNHQLHCNSRVKPTSTSLCLCEGVTNGATRGEKQPLSDTGLTNADYTLLSRQRDLVNEVLSLDGSAPDSIVLQNMYQLLMHRIATVVPEFTPNLLRQIGQNDMGQIVICNN